MAAYGFLSLPVASYRVFYWVPLGFLWCPHGVPQVSDVAMGQNQWAPVWVEEHPFATYVHQGFPGFDPPPRQALRADRSLLQPLCRSLLAALSHAEDVADEAWAALSQLLRRLGPAAAAELLAETDAKARAPRRNCRWPQEKAAAARLFFSPF